MTENGYNWPAQGQIEDFHRMPKKATKPADHSDHLASSPTQRVSRNQKQASLPQTTETQGEELELPTASEWGRVIGAAGMPLLVLDQDLNIRQFSDDLQNLINILPGDRGRPIGHLTHSLDYDNLTPAAKQVVESGSPFEETAQAQNGDWYLIRYQPYISENETQDGVVISFVRITALKRAEAELVAMKQLAEENADKRIKELDAANRQFNHALDMFLTLFHVNPIPTSITRLKDGLFLDVNKAYLEFYGLERDEVIGHTSIELKLPLAPSIRSNLIARVRKEGTIPNFRLEIVHPSGDIKTILASLQHVVIDKEDALMLAFSDITEQVRVERQVRTAATSLSAAEQADRQRISQILHDDLQQNIFAVKMQLSFLQDALEKNTADNAQVDLKQLDEWLAQAIAITRNLSVELSPPVLRGEGLTEILLWLAAQMKTQYNLQVNVAASDDQTFIPDDARIVVMQVLRELLFNVVKHSGTLEATVSLETLPDHVRITVADEGKGFDTKNLWENSLLTLRKLEDRLFLVGCSFQVESEPGTGTRVVIEAPTES